MSGNAEKVSYLAEKQGSDRDVIYTLRTVHQGQIQMIILADQKANILIGIVAIISTMLFTKGNFSLDLANPEALPLMGFLLLEMIALLFALLVIVPRSVGRERVGQIVESRNPLFWGYFNRFPQEEFMGYMQSQLVDDASAREMLSRDLYQMGLVLARKYRLLKTAYLFSAAGVAVLLSFFVATTGLASLS